jgi:hypothetical protein
MVAGKVGAEAGGCGGADGGGDGGADSRELDIEQFYEKRENNMRSLCVCVCNRVILYVYTI